MGRLDVIENYVKTGGVNGGKYTMDRLYQRANSFIRMVTNREEFQHMQTTMKSDKLETEVRSICGQDSIIEPFMINLLIMLPGQALPVHYDVPLFTDMRKDAAPGKYAPHLSSSLFYKLYIVHEKFCFTHD